MVTSRRIGSAVLFLASATLLACGSSSSDGSAGSSDVVTAEPMGSAEQPGSTEPTKTSIEVTDRPEEFDARLTDGPEREEAVRLLDEAVVALGAQRSSYYDDGDRFEVRIVEPTPQDDEVVARSQAGTSIPLEVVAVPMSQGWLERTALRLDTDLANPATSIGIDLVAGRLDVVVDRRNAPDLDDDALAEQVRVLLETYLAEGRREGAVADGVTADQAIGFVDGHTNW